MIESEVKEVSVKELIKQTQMALLNFSPKVEIGRNDPCSCGSGKKYKKCCGA